MPVEELSPAERRVQLIAAAGGLVIAAAVAVAIGVSTGVEAGLAVFFLSWTFVAVLVLVVRFVYRRVSATPVIPPPAAPAPSPAEISSKAKRRRRRRR